MVREDYNAPSVVTGSLRFDVRNKGIKRQHDLNFNLVVKTSFNASF